MLAGAATVFLIAWFWPTPSSFNDDPRPANSDHEATRAGKRESDTYNKASPSTVEQAPRTVIVEVVNSENAPVGGAHVAQITLSGDKKVGQTLADGTLELSMQRPTTIRVHALGYDEQVFSPPQFGTAPEVFWSVKLAPKAATTLTGFVSSDEKPVANAVVVLLGETLAHTHLVRTAKDGRFRFRRPPSTSLAIAVISAGHGEHISSQRPREHEIAISLPPPAYVEGTVTDAHGQGIDGVTIRLAPKTRRLQDARLQRLLRDLQKNKGRRAQARWLQRATSNVDTRITLHPPDSGPQDQGPQDQDAQDQDAQDQVAKELPIHFRAGPMAAGRTDVLAFANGYAPAEVEDLDLAQGKTTHGVKLVLGATGTIIGRVLDRETGKGVRGATLTTTGSHNLPGFGQAKSQNDGSFSISVIPSARQRLRARARGYLPFETGGVVVERGQELEKLIELSPGTNKGPLRRREYVGIGATVKKVDDGVAIMKTIKNGPAASSLLAGDIILRVDSTWVDDLDIQDAIELLVGEPETGVELLVRRTGKDGVPQELDLALTRERLTYESH